MSLISRSAFEMGPASALNFGLTHFLPHVIYQRSATQRHRTFFWGPRRSWLKSGRFLMTTPPLSLRCGQMCETEGPSEVPHYCESRSVLSVTVILFSHVFDPGGREQSTRTRGDTTRNTVVRQCNSCCNSCCIIPCDACRGLCSNGWG